MAVGRQLDADKTKLFYTAPQLGAVIVRPKMRIDRSHPPYPSGMCLAERGNPVVCGARILQIGPCNAGLDDRAADSVFCHCAEQPRFCHLKIVNHIPAKMAVRVNDHANLLN